MFSEEVSGDLLDSKEEQEGRRSSFDCRVVTQVGCNRAGCTQKAPQQGQGVSGIDLPLYRMQVLGKC